MKFSKYLLLLLTFIGVAVVSSSCSKDDDSNWNEYQNTHRSLSFNGSYVVYPADSFSQFHTNPQLPGFTFSFDTVANATTYLGDADSTCQIIYMVSNENGITDSMLNREIDVEYGIFNAENNFNMEGVKETYYMAGVGKDVTSLTYYMYGIKFIYYYMINPNTNKAFCIEVKGSEKFTSYWNMVTEILSTFTFRE